MPLALIHSAMASLSGRKLLKGPFVHAGGATWMAPAPASGDGPDDHFASTLCLYEDGARLTRAHATRAAIELGGQGRYRHWDHGGPPTLYFSTTDGSDPNANGRTYSYDLGLDVGDWERARRRDAAERWRLHPDGAQLLGSGGEQIPPPLMANLGLTNKCNLRCEICGSQKHLGATGVRRRHMEYATFQAVAETLFPFLSLVELNSQGDPLLHPRIEDILETIERHGCEVKIQHNGTLLRDSVVDLLLRHHGTVMLSLDAVGSRFDEVRQGGVWERAAPGIERLLRERSPSRLAIGVYPTMTARTIGSALALVEWCAAHDVDEIGFHRYAPVQGSWEVSPSDADYARLCEDLRAWCVRNGDRLRIQFEGEVLNETPPPLRRTEYASLYKALALMDSGKMMFPMEPKRPGGDPLTTCAAPDEYVEIGLDGQIGACCRAQDVALGYATSLESFAQAWLGANYGKLRRSLQRGAEGPFVLPNCAGCVAFFAPGELRGRCAVDYSKPPTPGEERLELSGGDVIRIESIQKEEGFCHIAVFPLGLQGDYELWEDDRPLGPGGSYHADIRAGGGGRHHVGPTSVYFSTSDGTDARRNGRSYTLRRRDPAGLRSAEPKQPGQAELSGAPRGAV